MMEVYTAIGQWFEFLHLAKPEIWGKATVWAIPAYIVVWNIVFDDYADFLDSLVYIFQPNWLSALRGEWSQDCWQSLKFMFWFLLCLASVTGLYRFLQ